MKNFEQFYQWYLRYFQSKDELTATIYDKFMALSYAVRTHIIDDWIETQKVYRQHSVRRVYTLSLDHSYGRSLHRHIIEVGMEEDVKNITSFLNASYTDILECEPEFELGNCPIGGLSQCFQETMASQGIPAMGYGVWYDFAMFKQNIVDGMQVEIPYNWENEVHPWSINRPEYSYPVSFGGTVQYDESGIARWIPAEQVVATPWDYPVVGYKNGVVNTVRFWEAVATGNFTSDYAHHGDYTRACSDKYSSTDVTRFLFPDGDVKQTSDLRIKQQYFMVAASLYDIVRRHKVENGSVKTLPEKVVIHITDSKSAIAVVEMLRILIYDENIPMSEAMELLQKIFIFSTSAMTYDEFERWPLYLLEEILPLHTKLIFDMNHYFLHKWRTEYGISDDDAREISIIEEGTVKKVRLAHAAVLVAFSVTGMSDFQTTRMRESVFSRIASVRKNRFLTGSYGISIRRSLAVANPQLTDLVSSCIGEGWIAHNNDLIKMVNYATSRSVQEKFLALKVEAKKSLASYIQNRFGIEYNVDSMIVMQCRRIHPALRQIMQLFYVVKRYLQLKSGAVLSARTYFVGGRAAPTNFLGKQQIHLINIVSDLINRDPQTKSLLQIHFIPNCGVTLEEQFLPAIDLVEHIAAPSVIPFGMDILKYVVNGALPLFGGSEADHEVADMLGANNCFSFEEIACDRASYDPNVVVSQSGTLLDVFEFIESHIPEFSKGEAVYPLLSTLRYNDEFLTVGSFDAYCNVQDKVDALYSQPLKWAEWAIHNLGRSGIGSLDQVVQNFFTQTWND